MIDSNKKTFSWWLINYLHSEQKVNTSFLMTGGGIFHLCNALSDQREKIKSLFLSRTASNICSRRNIKVN